MSFTFLEAELLAALKALVKSTEEWNEAVIAIIGREPQTGMNGPLQNAKAVIARVEGNQ